MMLKLQDEGALNINLVAPNHLILPVLRALKAAYEQGLFCPWCIIQTRIKKAWSLLEGIVDVYLPLGGV